MVMCLEVILLQLMGSHYLWYPSYHSPVSSCSTEWNSTTRILSIQSSATFWPTQYRRWTHRWTKLQMWQYLYLGTFWIGIKVRQDTLNMNIHLTIMFFHVFLVNGLCRDIDDPMSDKIEFMDRHIFWMGKFSFFISFFLAMYLPLLYFNIWY